MAKFVRLDVMSGNKDNSQVKSAKYYDNDATAAVENGTVVAIGGLLEGEREIHKVTAVGETDTYVGLVTTPELDYNENGYRGIDTFTNEKDAVIRVHVLHEGDIFSIGNSTDTNDLDMGAKLVGEHIATETAGRFTYQVYEVKAKVAEETEQVDTTGGDTTGGDTTGGDTTGGDTTGGDTTGGEG